MADISKLVPYILKWEGGFANNPNDKGGATMKGITLNTFISYRVSKKLPIPTVEDLKNITNSEWSAILKYFFWDGWKADEINDQSVANILVDWAWGSGTNTSIRSFQNSVSSLSPDGIVGKGTLGYINQQDPAELFKRIWDVRKTFLLNIVKRDPTQVVFLNGWLNRLTDMIHYNYGLNSKWA